MLGFFTCPNCKVYDKAPVTETVQYRHKDIQTNGIESPEMHQYLRPKSFQQGVKKTHNVETDGAWKTKYLKTKDEYMDPYFYTTNKVVQNGLKI